MVRQHIKIETDDGVNVHFPGINDATLCGLETTGDTSIGIQAGEITSDKVDCPHCIQTVKLCWKIKRTEIAGA